MAKNISLDFRLKKQKKQEIVIQEKQNKISQWAKSIKEHVKL